MTLLLDHGLRVGELAALQVTDVNLAERVLRFYRAKVDKEQTHRLTLNSIQALRVWICIVTAFRSARCCVAAARAVN